MSDSPSPLDPRDLALLRAETPPPDDAVVRARARLVAVVPMMGNGETGAGAGANANAGTGAGVGASVGVGKVVAVGAMMFVAGGAMGALAVGALHATPAARIVVVPQPVVVAGPSLPSPAPSPDTTAVAPVDSSVPPVARSAAPLPASASASASPHSQLSAERMLLDEARAALVQGDPTVALDRLQRHRHSFASPILGEERDAMEVEALARAGRTSEAQARADAFRRHYPRSLFLPTVESAATNP